jgi:hypothetical protein
MWDQIVSIPDYYADSALSLSSGKHRKFVKILHLTRAFQEDPFTDKAKSAPVVIFTEKPAKPFWL